MIDLQKAVKENRIFLPSSNLGKYLFDFFPADYGGLSEVLDEQKYENLNFFEYKRSKARSTPSLEVKQGLVCVPLENRNENLNINYNATSIVNIESLNNNISLERSETSNLKAVPTPQTISFPNSAGNTAPHLIPNLSQTNPQAFIPQNIPYYIPYYRNPLFPLVLPRHPMAMMHEGLTNLNVTQSTKSRGQSESRSRSKSRSKSGKESESSRRKHRSKINFN